MKRKLLFVLFEDDHCRAAHAGWYACDLHAAGHEVAILLEGGAVRLLSDINSSQDSWAVALKEALTKGLIVGACRGAATGCGGNMVEAARSLDIPLRDGMNGHASIRAFVDDGFELTLF